MDKWITKDAGPEQDGRRSGQGQRENLPFRETLRQMSSAWAGRLMMLGAIGFGLAGCGANQAPHAPDLEAGIAPYSAAAPVSGPLRVRGSQVDAALIERLQQGFAKHQPGVTFSNVLTGPEAPLAGVYTGTADVAFMARELRLPMESMAFEWALLSKPYEVTIAHAGLTADRLSSQLAVFVHRDNPLTALSLPQLRAIFSADDALGDGLIREWGQLGLDKTWQDRSVRPYGPRVDSIAALYIRGTVLRNSRKWNPEYNELGDDGEAALAALADDPAGIAFAPLRMATPSVKALHLGQDDAGPFHPLTTRNVISRTYPLVRSLTVVMPRPPEQALNPVLAEFLRYVLSRDGQAIVAAEGSYLPLSAETAQQQRQRLE